MADGIIEAEVTANIEPFKKKLQTALEAAETFSKSLDKKLAEGAGGMVQGIMQDVDAVQKLVPEFKKLKTPLTEIGQSVRPLNTALKNMAKNLADVASSATLAATGLTTVATQMGRLDQTLTSITTKMTQNTTATREFSAAQRDIQKSATQAAQGAEKAGDKIEDAGDAAKGASKETEKFDKQMGALADSAALVTGPLGGFASRITVLKRAANAGTLALVGLSTAATGFGFLLKAAVVEAEKFETSMLKLEGVVQATGGAAGVSAKEIRAFARELDLSTLGDALELEAAAAKLLMFKGVAGDVFKDTLVVAQDFASIGLGSVESNVKSLGAALEDPAARISRLERTFGVRFNPTVRDTAEALDNLGRRAQAQRMILEELKKTTEGVAGNMASGLGGALDTLSLRWREFKLAIADAFNGLENATEVVNGSGKVFEVLTLTVEALTGKVKGLAETQPALVEWAKKGLGGVTGPLGTLIRLGDDLDPVINGLEKMVTVEGQLASALEERAELEADLQRFTDDDGEPKRGAAVPFLRIKAEIKELDKKIVRLNTIIQKNKDDAAAAKAKSEAEQDALDAEKERQGLLKKQKAEQNRLNSLREVSLRSLKDDNTIAEMLLATSGDRVRSEKEIEATRGRITRLVRLGLVDADTDIENLREQAEAAKARGDAVAELAIRQKIANAEARIALENELEKRGEIFGILDATLALEANARRDTLKGEELDAEIRAAEMLLEAAGKSAQLQEEASQRARIHIRLQARLQKFQSMGVTLSDKQIEKERESIALLVEKEDELKNVEAAISEVAEAQQEAVERQQEFQEALASGIADLATAGGSFREVLADIITSLSAAIVKAEALAFIQSSMGSGGSGNNVLGTVLNAIGGALGGVGQTTPAAVTDPDVIQGPFIRREVAHQGGIIGQIASSRVVPMSNFIDAPRFHNGLRQNEVPAILERGEEVIPKDQVGRRRDRGDTNITFNVTTPNADSFKRSQRQMSMQARKAVAR